MSSIVASNPSKKTLATKLWNEKKSLCARHLVIKKIVLALLVLFTLGSLYCACSNYYAHFSQYSLFTQTITLSPMIAGVLGMLVYLKFPTGGVDDKSVIVVSRALGKAVAWILFAPLMICIKSCDWTHYEDKKVADGIINDLQMCREDIDPENFQKTLNRFEKIMNYKDAFYILARYGYFTDNDAKDMHEMAIAYKPQKKLYDDCMKKKDNPEKQPLLVKAKAELITLLTTWSNKIKNIDFPDTALTVEDFDTTGTLTRAIRHFSESA